MRSCAPIPQGAMGIERTRQWDDLVESEGIWRVLACPVRMLRTIRSMETESQGGTG